MGNPRDNQVENLRKTLQYALDTEREMARQQERLNELIAENPEAATSYQIRSWQEHIHQIREESRVSRLITEEALNRRLLLADIAAEKAAEIAADN